MKWICSQRVDFENYFSLFQLTSSLIAPPDLVIYLRASVSTLVKHIQNRGRQYENTIRLDYLQRLNQRYETWVKSYASGKLIIIDTDKHTSLEWSESKYYVIDKIDAELHGLF